MELTLGGELTRTFGTSIELFANWIAAEAEYEDRDVSYWPKKGPPAPILATRAQREILASLAADLSRPITWTKAWQNSAPDGEKDQPETE